MYAFRNSTRRQRRLVWLTLLMWLFALASGVVNACVLSIPERTAEGSSPPVHSEAATHARPSEGVGAHGADDRETGSGSSGKVTCLKFCDDESSAITKSASSGADMVVALVDARIERRLAVPAAQTDSGSSLEPPRAQGPTLVIRFLRLTL